MLKKTYTQAPADLTGAVGGKRIDNDDVIGHLPDGFNAAADVTLFVMRDDDHRQGRHDKAFGGSKILKC
jgi:hypothetical protein